MYAPVHICKIVLRTSESCNSLREFYEGRKGGWFTWKEEDGMAEWVDSKEIDSNVALALIFSCIFNVSLSLSPPPFSFDRFCNIKIPEFHV